MFTQNLIKYEYRKRIHRVRIGLAGILIYNLLILLFHYIPASQMLTSTFAQNEGVALLINELSSIYFLPMAVLAVFAFIDIYHLPSYSFFRQIPYSSTCILWTKLFGANAEFFFFGTLQYFMSLVFFYAFILPQSITYPESYTLFKTFVSSSFLFHFLVLFSTNLLNAIVLFFYSFFSFNKVVKSSSKVCFYLIHTCIAILCLLFFNHIFNNMVTFISSTFYKNYIESVSFSNIFLTLLFFIVGALIFSFPFMVLLDKKLDLTQ
jgi:hypothetical protein